MPISSILDINNHLMLRVKKNKKSLGPSNQVVGVQEEINNSHDNLSQPQKIGPPVVMIMVTIAIATATRVVTPIRDSTHVP